MKLSDAQISLVKNILAQANETFKVLIKTSPLDSAHSTQASDSKSPAVHDLENHKNESINKLRALIHPEPLNYSKYNILALRYVTDLLTSGKLYINSNIEPIIKAHLKNAENQVNDNISRNSESEMASSLLVKSTKSFNKHFS